MRKMFVSACLFAAMAFTACTTEVIYVDSDGNPVENVDLKEGEGLLSVAVSSTDVSTRAARPIGSSAADNNVNVVKVYVFSSAQSEGSYKFDNTVGVKTVQSDVTGSAGVITISNFSSTGGEHTVEGSADSHVDQQKTITLTGLDPAKYYKFVAVGYNDADEADEQVNPYGEPSLVAGTTTLVAFTTSTEKTGYDIEELFATQSSEAKKGDAKNQGTLTLTRQVAGMLAYFKNVPATINGKSVAAIRIYANKSFTQFTYPATTDFNGFATSAETSSPTNKHLLMEFMLGTSEGSISTGTDADGYYTFNTLSNGNVSDNGSSNNGKAPVAKGYNMPTKLTLEANSIFGGRYLIPYDQHYAAQNGEGSTLTIELQDADGTALRTLKVKTDQSMSGPATQYFYDIRCNNFYSIGQKYKTDTTDPDPDGGTDPDDPIDLSSKSEIVVQINDAWKVLHNMDVED